MFLNETLLTFKKNDYICNVKDAKSVVNYLITNRLEVLNEAYNFIEKVNKQPVLEDLSLLKEIYESFEGARLIEFYGVIQYLYEPSKLYGFKKESMLTDPLMSLFSCGKRNILHYLKLSKERFIKNKLFRQRVEEKSLHFLTKCNKKNVKH